MYSSPDTCDPWVCGLAEDLTPGGIVGTLFQASITEQFTRLRNGDRFWYEIPGRFTDTEIDEIHGITLPTLIREVFGDEVSPSALPKSSFFVNQRQLNSTSSVQSCSYDPLPAQFRSNAVQLSPLMQLSWAVDTATSRISFIIQACITGWVGIGFDSNPNTMAGADIIMCRYVIENSTAECTDRFSLDVGTPSLDTAINGTDDIIFFNGTITASGVRRFFVTRPLNSGDARDKPLGAFSTKLLFAYNPETTNFNYHGPARSAEHSFMFAPAALKISTGLTAFAGVISVIGCGVSIFFFILVIVKSAYFKYQAPIFCCMIIAGTLLGHASVWAFMAEFTDASCTINVWLINLSFVLVFACLSMKTWRLWRVVGQKNLKVTIVTVGDVLKIVGIFVMIELIFLILWTVFDRPQALVVRDSSFGIELSTYHLVCKAPLGIFWYISIAYKVALLIGCVFISAKVRNLEKIFNDSKEIGVSIYVAAFTMVILIIVSVVLEWSVEATYVTRVVGSTIPYTAICLVLFTKQLARILQGKPPLRYSRAVSMSTASDTGSYYESETGSGNRVNAPAALANGAAATSSQSRNVRRISSMDVGGPTSADDSDSDTGEHVRGFASDAIAAPMGDENSSVDLSPMKKKSFRKPVVEEEEEDSAEEADHTAAEPEKVKDKSQDKKQKDKTKKKKNNNKTKSAAVSATEELDAAEEESEEREEEEKEKKKKKKQKAKDKLKKKQRAGLDAPSLVLTQDSPRSDDEVKVDVDSI